uniref:Heat shock 70 kDa protein 12A-like isoform X2 n=1 Tax=Crassostrea virginica TaxID=6565 RepID=A0A8B8DDM8_CRAVI|nr:heat shock 70 kDa protein 12A-like isoform X2 [Crassostrea virginica]
MSSLLVAAIDFGTTFSGYAFSFLHDYKREPLKISTNSWTAGVGQLMTLKTSTCVLFDAAGKFHSFGFEAEEKYSNLALDDNHHDWYYFRRFKMMLYDKKGLTRESLIEDDKGKKMEAMKVFSEAIGYLRNHLLSTCKNQLTGIEDSDITWVLTVPAIWTDPSKQFMREAAEKVGICRDKLVIALEPEAASIYCMHLPVHKDSENSTFGVFKSGSKYMVVDAGGGFAESPMLQEAVREAFRNKKVIVPQDAGLAVLKGAVLYGHQPKTISARVCKYTYGVETNVKFNNDIHPQSKKVLFDEVEYCGNVFSVHVPVGKLIKVGEPQVEQVYRVIKPDQTGIDFKIYTSNEREPTYTTDVGCTLLGTFTIDMPDTSKGTDRGAFVHMTFSGTEITVTAVDKDDATKTVSTKVDFLG